MTKLRFSRPAPFSHGSRSLLRSHRCWWVSTMGIAGSAATVFFSSVCAERSAALSSRLNPAAAPAADSMNLRRVIPMACRSPD